jgi:hypothetical protein
MSSSVTKSNFFFIPGTNYILLALPLGTGLPTDLLDISLIIIIIIIKEKGN